MNITENYAGIFVSTVLLYQNMLTIQFQTKFNVSFCELVYNYISKLSKLNTRESILMKILSAFYLLVTVF